MYIIPGILGFFACCLFDLNKVKWQSRILNHFFTIGSLLLVYSTLSALLKSDFKTLIHNFHIEQGLLLVGILLSGAALIYVLFFALPFESTYMETETLPVVDSGVYAACRHPGFWVFALFYLLLGFFLSNPYVTLEAIIYSICNFIYIYIQDRFIFPHYIRGYDEYKKTVPFLIPNRRSFQKAFSRNCCSK